MSFPLSPANNQVTLENGISYTYNASRNFWYRTPTTALSAITSNTVTVLNSIIFSDGTTQTTAANPTDSFARTTANTATNNITILQGVNTDQNNRITIAEGVDIGQNTRMAIIEGVDATQNTNITVADTKAQASFDKANTSITTSGGTITGSLNVSQNLSVTGNLTVLGALTTVNTSSFTVTDSLIQLGIGNYTSDLLDIGISAHYNDGTNAHTGFIRDHTTKEWYVFKGYTPELSANNNIDINHASFAKANVHADFFKGNVAFPDGTTQTTAANPTDAYARTTANTATDNIVILQGVNTDQNTRITISEGVDVGQNTRMSIIEGVDTDQNTRITIAEGVDVGQNTRMSIIEGVDATQNTNITIATDAGQSAFAQANATAGGLTSANTRLTIIEGVDLDQNTRITAADTKAQAAFNAANTGGGGTDQYARDTANLAIGIDATQNTRMSIIEGVDATQNTNITIATNDATAAFARANAAYELANTANNTASSGGGGGASISTSSYNYRKYQGDGSTVAFTISSGHTANTVLVFNNGVCQMPFDDYTVSATTLTYVIAPQSDETIQIRELPVA